VLDGVDPWCVDEIQGNDVRPLESMSNNPFHLGGVARDWWAHTWK